MNMSEELHTQTAENTELAPATETKREETKGISRRAALFGALLAGAVSSAKEAKAADLDCSCLPAPDCSAVCSNGGAPRGDGTQACDCYENPKLPTLAQVAYSGDYNDLKNKPTISLNNIVTAGSAGPTGNSSVTFTKYSNGANPVLSSGSIKVPYFSVNAQGRVTGYATRTFSVNVSTYSNYYNYGNYYQYGDYNCNDGE